MNTFYSEVGNVFFLLLLNVDNIILSTIFLGVLLRLQNVAFLEQPIQHTTITTTTKPYTRVLLCFLMFW